MRVLFSSGGGHPHMYQTVPLAWALRAAGHEVRLAVAPRMLDAALSTGIPALAVGTSPVLTARERQDLLDTAYGQPPWPGNWPAYPERLDRSQRAYLLALGRYVAATAAAVVDDLLDFAREWSPDLIVYDTMAMAGAVVATVREVPGVRQMTGTQDAFRVELRPDDGRPLPEYARLFERFGRAAPVDPDPYIDTTPPKMFLERERPRIDMRWIPYNGPGVQPDGLTGPRRRPRVCVTWGLTVPGALGSAAADSFRETIDAVVAAGADALVLASAEQIAHLDAPPAHVRYVSGAPLHMVVPYCDAVVDQGGDGSMMTPAAAAVPQLVITREPLQDQNGARLARSGAGIHIRHQELPGGAAGTAELRELVNRLLADPRYGQAAADLAEEIAGQPSPVEVVPTLAALPA
ncbi:MAG TPA: nucleotide disphospho-sugar-binding domain-containing protein [Rugosimonospora sp.]|nr:nucleotide disphospho-sugar-binding domain-containing protein [Rugosimonospora sp.]